MKIKRRDIMILAGQLMCIPFAIIGMDSMYDGDGVNTLVVLIVVLLIFLSLVLQIEKITNAIGKES